MAKKIYVGNLPWSTTSAKLESLFGAHGTVRSAEVISDRDTGRSRGFGFVEMESDDACEKAIEALNGQEVDGRAITVNEARERSPRPGAAVAAAGAATVVVAAEVAVVVGRRIRSRLKPSAQAPVDCSAEDLTACGFAGTT